ncbi:peptidase inhibitor family I36 protein [Streptomyces hundungensis]|uniref:peptidase inhibitor family I36 protein n=1 Tax=Streptomyces hundungensis TaxID=1077946 RepID=UPI0013C44EB7|nr:peptidase inhibitor family I36 protein [Streptomyces hundungensis]
MFRDSRYAPRRFVAAASGVVSAGPHDNNGASVSGVAGISPNEGCTPGYFCIYTGANYTGTMFRMYHCVEYHLNNWDGVGSWINDNTGGAHALIQDRNYNTLVDTDTDTDPDTDTDTDTDPDNNWYNGNYNFAPAWHVKAC